MENNKATLEKMWETLEPLLTKMLSNGSLTKTEHTQICNCVYGYCTYVNNTDSFADKYQASSIKLCSKLQQFFTKHVVSLAERTSSLNDSDLLSLYEKYWTIYSLAAQHLDKRCDYLNRNLMKSKVAGFPNGFSNLYSLILTIWKDEYFLPFHEALIKAILCEIEKERRGECISVLRLHTVIGSVLKLCVTSPPISIASLYPQSTDYRRRYNDILSSNIDDPEMYLPFYRDHFEKAFLRQTIRFYETESRSYLTKHTIPDYLKWVEVCVENERKRTDFYLHKSSLNELLNTTYNCLIKNHIEKIASEFRKLLDENRVESLTLMQNLLFRYKEGEHRLVEMLESYVIEFGLTALQRVCNTVKSKPRVFMDTIIEVMEKMENFIDTVFSKHPSFSRAVARACESFINNNAVTEIHGSAPELIAKCADIILRKCPRKAREYDVDIGIARVMKLFKFVEDKDAFQKFYAKFLARRLVYEQSISGSSEHSMISFLKDHCGNAYTTKLHMMLRDIKDSRSLKGAFYNWLDTKRKEENYQINKFSVEFSPMVLSSKAWPYKAQTQLNLPYELEKCRSVFTEFYSSEHEKRRLSWCYHISRGEIQTHYTTTNYTFAVSTYQMVVLVLFNDNISYTVRQIKEFTNIEENTLDQILDVLVRSQILKVVTGETITEAQLRRQQQQQQPEGDSLAVCTTDLTLTPDTYLTLCFNYSNPRMYVKLDKPIKNELEKESEKIFKDIESDRKLTIQACIVRIMKSRKRLDHQQLIGEVMDQMSSRFNPTVSQIKECIAFLIERDFIKRDPNNPCFYEYVALPVFPTA